MKGVGGRWRVLVVEDEVNLAETIRDGLGGEGVSPWTSCTPGVDGFVGGHRVAARSL